MERHLTSVPPVHLCLSPPCAPRPGSLPCSCCSPSSLASCQPRRHRLLRPRPAPGCRATFTKVPSPTAITYVPDLGSATRTLTVSGAKRYVRDIDVELQMNALSPADLTLRLTSPSGRTITMSSGNGRIRSLDYVSFDDSANPGGQIPYARDNNPGSASEHPYADYQNGLTLTPEEPLAAFNGEDPNGTWTLTAIDGVTGYTASITASCYGSPRATVCCGTSRRRRSPAP